MNTEEESDEVTDGNEGSSPKSDQREDEASGVVADVPDATTGRNQEADSPPPTGRPFPVKSLDRYAARLGEAGEVPLQAAVGGYATNVRKAQSGALPSAASRLPSGLTGDLVGDALVGTRLISVIELLRNALIFSPVIWTWFEIGRAATAYGDVVRGLPEEVAVPSFLVLWEEGFGESAGPLTASLTTTAWVAVGLLLALIATNTLLTIVRGRAEAERASIAQDFAVTIAQIELMQPTGEPDDVQGALEEFARTGRELTSNLQAVGESLRSTAAPFAESVSIANSVLADMSQAARTQAEQLDRIANSLLEIASLGERLEGVRHAFVGAEEAARHNAEAFNSSQALIAPSAEHISTASAELAQVAQLISRSTDIFTHTLANLSDGAERYDESLANLNLVATRLIEQTDH